MPVLLDTGVIYALADRDDAWHQRCVDYIAALRQPLVTPVTTIPEAAYLIRERLGADAERALITSIAAHELDVEELHPVDWDRASELMEAYGDIGFVDASIVAVAERLRLTSIATTDRRHFAQIRPQHRKSFELLP